jgi:fructosamine-3-kinase
MAHEGDHWVAVRIGDLLGVPVTACTPIGAGGFGRPFRAGTADGRQVFAKVQADAPEGFFEHEAYGLRWLADSGGVRVPAVLAVDPEMLIIEWLPSGSPSPSAAYDLGCRLADTHAAGAPGFGRATDSLLADEPLPSGRGHGDWPSFYAGARLRPFLERASTRGSIGADDRRAVTEVIERLPELVGPAEPPARLHGDLWSGNVLWTPDGAAVIDPAVYGGHREIDLAMLALFGLPHLDTLLDGYQQTHPLAPGWRQRVPLHQLFPLLVHAAIFGGSYGRAAGDAARRALTG